MKVFAVAAWLTVIGDVVDVSRFANRDHFASYNGTAPIEVSSGPRKVYRLSRRGNRRINHAIHMAAVTQVRHPTSEGRAYYDRKLAEGKTGKEALRSLKRRISDAIFARLQVDAHQLERFVVTDVPVEFSINPLTRETDGVFGDSRNPLATPRAVSTITAGL